MEWTKNKNSQSTSDKFLDSEFLGLNKCIQCGTCTGICPVANEMTLSPRQVVNLTNQGSIDPILEANTIWTCTSCYACSENCPKQIKITDLMYSLKRLAISKRHIPKGVKGNVLSELFYDKVAKNGRINDSLLATEFFARANPKELLKSAKMGARLFLKGRISLHPEGIKNQKQIKQILKASIKYQEKN